MDTIFRKQRGKIQVSVPTRLRHCPTKSEIYLAVLLALGSC
jgi:hypothetical protein